jgi:lipopolysaccharide transport system permease protein
VYEQTVVIEAGRRWRPFSWPEVWAYRNFFLTIVWRDVTVRYKQTVIGVGWVVFQPLVMAAFLTLFFGRWLEVPSDGKPYPLFAYVALLVWGLFARGLSHGATSLVTNESILSKVYFPRILIPAASLAVGCVDFVCSLAPLVPLFWWYGVAPGPEAILFPLFVLLALAAALGVAAFFSILDAVFRDVRQALPFLTQVLLFATPVIYPASAVPAAWRALYWANPMAGAVEGVRWCLLGGPRPDAALLAVSAASGLGILAAGVLFFLRWERKIVDRI